MTDYKQCVIMIDTSDELIAKLKESDIKNISCILTHFIGFNKFPDEKFLKSQFLQNYFLKKIKGIFA